ncbi:MAG: LuxR family transcriptional regulator [Mycobacterium sp.]|jgi:DNA-binding CsgD family transcriptional regulator|nr:LuxR family transcriptional regulator [Mycobacterium sp.]
MSIDTAVPTYALMDLVGALRQLGATVSLPPAVEAAQANGLAPYGYFRTAPRQLPSGQALSDTEISVLRYLPTHLTLQEIARELCRSVDTIKTHVRHLYIKLDAHSRSEAVRNARVSGVLA